MGKSRRRHASPFRRYWRDFNPLGNFRLMTRNLVGDTRAGVVVALYALTAALALSLLAGQAFPDSALGSLATIRTAVFVALIAALLGGTPATVSGPALVTVLAASVVIHRHRLPGMNYVVLVFVLAGLLQLLAGLSKRARFVTYVPQPVISGFTNACAVAVMLFAAHLVLGHNPLDAKLGFLPAFPAITQIRPFFQPVNLYALAAGGATVILGLLLRRRVRALPALLVAIIAVTAGIHVYARLGGVELSVFGSTFAVAKANIAHFVGLPSHGIPLIDVILPAVILAFLGAAQSLSTADTCDNLSHTLHNSNRELWGLGIANTAGAFCGALPGGGQIESSTVSFRYGGRTPLAAVLSAVLLGVAAAFLAPFVRLLHLAPLAGALFVMGADALDTTPFKRLRTAKLADVIMMLVVLAVGLFADFYVACIVAFLISVMMMLDRIAIYLNNRLISLQDRREKWRGEGALAPHLRRFCLIYRIDRPLAINFLGDYLRAVRPATQPKAVFIRMNAVPALDRSALLDLSYHINRLRNRAVRVYLTGVGKTLLKQLDEAGIVDRLEESHITNRFSDAARLCETELANDPHVKLYAVSKDVGRSVKAIQYRQALANHVVKDTAKAIFTFAILMIMVMAGYAVLATLGWMLLGALNVLFLLRGVTSLHYAIFMASLFALVTLITILTAFRRKIRLTDPGYYVGGEEFFIRGGRPLAGCLLLVPRLLAITLMEVFEFFSRRFHKNTLDTASIILAKLPDKTTWETLRKDLGGYALYDVRMAMAGLRALGIIYYTEKTEEDFDIELSEEGKKFIHSVEDFSEEPAADA